MANHAKPGTGPTYGTHTETLWLSDDAETALGVFQSILADRTAEATGDQVTPTINRDALNAALEETRGTVAGELLHTAVVHAESIPMPWTKPLHKQSRDEQATRPNTVAWDMTVTLAAETERLAPASSLPREQDSNTCSHGVSFADPCDECGA